MNDISEPPILTAQSGRSQHPSGQGNTGRYQARRLAYCSGVDRAAPPRCAVGEVHPRVHRRVESAWPADLRSAPTGSPQRVVTIGAMPRRPLTGREERAFALLTLLEGGAATAAEVCDVLEWSRGQFDGALRFAREELGPHIGATIPQPVPDDGFRYHLTGEWTHVDGSPAIAAGTAYAMTGIETRLRAILRDTKIAAKNASPRSINGRRANFLNKHLTHILDVLNEIGPVPSTGEEEL